MGVGKILKGIFHKILAFAGFSTLSVVRNPADQYPLYSCIIIAAGLILHFARKLTRYVRVEAKTS